jgi:hypothetical protein
MRRLEENIPHTGLIAANAMLEPAHYTQDKRNTGIFLQLTLNPMRSVKRAVDKDLHSGWIMQAVTNLFTVISVDGDNPGRYGASFPSVPKGDAWFATRA